jgi:exopolysaccharide biosynthesis predicted pyruvyltransferase EpsI
VTRVPSSGSGAVVEHLAGRIDEVLNVLVEAGQPCALLDFPSHANVGDSAIWLGEREYLERNGIDVVYACDSATYSRALLEDRVGHGTILLHGGGNLGDIWMSHQWFRERVIREFPDNQIIQLPQTIHFQDPEHLNRTREVFDAHPSLTLLCRDEQSLELAQTNFQARSLLCPDMAFALRQLPPTRPPVVDILWLSRTDSESSGAALPEAVACMERTDWLTDIPTALIERNQYLSEKFWEEESESIADLLARTYDPLAWERVQRGCRLLSRGRVVVTDRLHGHILCLLLGIPHVILDNNYGKLRGFHEAWTRTSPLVVQAADPNEALDLATTLLNLRAGTTGHGEPADCIGAEALYQRELGEAIDNLIPFGSRFLLVDQDMCRGQFRTSCSPIPFPERSGQYAGLPEDDDFALTELERLRHSGAEYIVFAWPAFWWLGPFSGYPRLHRHLRATFPCIAESDRLVVFDLRHPIPSMADPSAHLVI